MAVAKLTMAKPSSSRFQGLRIDLAPVLSGISSSVVTRGEEMPERTGAIAASKAGDIETRNQPGFELYNLNASEFRAP